MTFWRTEELLWQEKCLRFRCSDHGIHTAENGSCGYHFKNLHVMNRGETIGMQQTTVKIKWY
jgi:hypothetical protein